MGSEKEPKKEKSDTKVSKPEVDESSDRVIPKNPDLGVAQLRFLVSLPANPDRAAHWDKLILAIKKYEMGPYYESVCAELHKPVDQALLTSLKDTNKTKIAEMEAKIKDAEENLGESEVREALQKKAEYVSQIGDKEGALSGLRKTFEKTVGIGNRIDNVFHQIRLGLFFTDHALVTANLDKAKSLMEKGGDWDRKNRLKAYEALYLASIRDFTAAAPLFLEAVPTFTATELLSYSDLVFYTVVVALIALDRPTLRSKVVGAAEITEELWSQSDLKTYLSSLYECKYAEFFKSLAWLEGKLKTDRYLHPHYGYYVRNMRVKAYSQLLASYSSLTLKSMAEYFGVTQEFMDKELHRMIASGDLHCRIDAVAGIVETWRLDGKNYQFQSVIREGDLLLNRIHKLSRVINV